MQHNDVLYCYAVVILYKQYTNDRRRRIYHHNKRSVGQVSTQLLQL